MLNTTVDTDLVGELVQVYGQRFERSTGMEHFLEVQGRIRAVTTTQTGALRLWLHLEDAECTMASAKYYSVPLKHSVVSFVIGDDHVLILLRNEQP